MTNILQAIWDFIKSAICGDQEYAENHKQILLSSLQKIKGGMLVFFIFILIFYIQKYRSRSEWYAGVMFNSKNSFSTTLIESVISGVMGVLAFFALYKLRQRPIDMNLLKTSVLVFSVLFAFEMAQEGSGFNRYMDKDKILNDQNDDQYVKEFGNGSTRVKQIMNNGTCRELANCVLNKDVDKYVKIRKNMNDTGNGTDCSTIYDIYAGGDPFTGTIGYAMLYVIGFTAIVLVGRMVFAAFYGYKSGEHNISDINYPVRGTNTKVMLFIMETLIFNGVFLSIAPIFGQLYEHKRIISWRQPILLFCLGICANLVFQYGGMYDSTRMRLPDMKPLQAYRDYESIQNL